MFYYVSGTVAHVEPYLAVIDCGGVGYACKTTSTTISQLQVGTQNDAAAVRHGDAGRDVVRKEQFFDRDGIGL